MNLKKCANVPRQNVGDILQGEHNLLGVLHLGLNALASIIHLNYFQKFAENV